MIFHLYFVFSIKYWMKLIVACWFVIGIWSSFFSKVSYVTGSLLDNMWVIIQFSNNTPNIPPRWYVFKLLVCLLLQQVDNFFRKQQASYCLFQCHGIAGIVQCINEVGNNSRLPKIGYNHNWFVWCSSRRILYS